MRLLPPAYAPGKGIICLAAGTCGTVNETGNQERHSSISQDLTVAVHQIKTEGINYKHAAASQNRQKVRRMRQRFESAQQSRGIIRLKPVNAEQKLD